MCMEPSWMLRPPIQRFSSTSSRLPPIGGSWSKSSSSSLSSSSFLWSSLPEPSLTLRHSMEGLGPSWEGRWPLLQLSLCRVVGRKAIFLELLRMASVPVSRPCLWPLCPTLRPLKHTGSGFGLCCEVAGSRSQQGASGGGCLHKEIFIKPYQPPPKVTLAARGDNALPCLLESEARRQNYPRDQLYHQVRT